MFSRIHAVTCAVVLGLAASVAGAWDIPLEVKDASGKGGPRMISGGVPLLPGQAKVVSELRLAVKDADGKLVAVPAQFRVLANYWRADNSIRWVLVDAETTLKPGEAKTFVLTNEKLDGPPAGALVVAETPEAIAITTGPAKFVINRKKFSFLERVLVGTDGKFAEGDDLLATTPDLGLVLRDTFGEKYYSSEGTGSVQVVEKGPVRVCIRARGVNKARDGKGYSRGMYGYDIFMNFYAGSTDVNCDVVITNNFTKSIGSPTFKDASLVLKLKGGASGFSLLGDKDKATEGKLAGAESACLYQDSNGADTWERCTGFADMNSNGWSSLKTKLTSFRGYKVLKRAAGKEEELATGDHASGVLNAINDRGGVIVHMRNFWQQFPKAAEVAADGTVRVGLFPAEFAVPHYLEDGAAKGHEIVLHFYRAGAKDAYDVADAAKPAAVAAAWDVRTFPRPDIKHICATGALVDLGPYTVPKHGMDRKPSNQVAIDAPRALSDDRLYGNAFGWQVFGERWRSNGGHSQHGARQPIKEDDYLYEWYVTGLPEWLAVGEARSRQFRDVRNYRIDDQEPFAFKDWDDFSKSNLRENGWCKRPQPNDAEIKKYSDGFWARSGWEFPNPEHTTLDLIYDRAMLFGDMRAYENMRVIAANGGFYAIKAAPTIMRFTGWGWRAIERYWELTGDKQAEALLRRTLKAFTGLIGKGPLAAPIKDPDPSDYKSWHTMIWNRPLAMTALHLGDPEAIALAKTAAEGHEDKADYYCTLFAVLYHLTGEQKYKDAVLKASNDGDKISVVRDVDDKSWSHMGHVFPCSALWLLEQPPVKK